MKVYEGKVAPLSEWKGNITIIVSRFNQTITQRLLDGALAVLRQYIQEEQIRVVWVPGAYELPFMTSRLIHDPDCSATICLGAVIKGETTHDQHINRFVSMELGKIAVQHGKPVIFGLLTCDTIEQAQARSGMKTSKKDKVLHPASGNKGAEAAEAALEMINLLSQFPHYDIPQNSNEHE